ncbi:MAG: transposase [Acidimicrobiales bacterium]
MAEATVPRSCVSENLRSLLASPEVAALVADLEATRWTGRPGYPLRAMVGMALVKSLYALPTWTRTVRLVAEHDGLRRVLGCAPSLDACYRFTAKLRQHNDALQACIAAVLSSLHADMPDMGSTVAIDGSDLPAYANGQRYVSARSKIERKRFSDPDASWGHRSSISTRKGGGFYGYKVHAVVDVATELPIAWEVRTARDAETPLVPGLLDKVAGYGFGPSVAILDRGYDQTPVYEACESRGIRPVIPLRETPAVKQGKHLPASCEHGTWTFAGSDAKRGASKWRCPTGDCQPASVWVKADRLHTLIPRTTARFKALYHRRGCVERGFGRLKHEWAMMPLRVRRLARVAVHVDLTVLSQLATALAKTRVVPFAA